MLITSVVAYFFITLAIGYYANQKISSTSDFMNAGRNLPPLVNSFAMFALWFGSETLFGASAEFAESGLIGIIEDPFGGALCLLLVGFFYSRKLYRMNLLTIGDLFRDRFGHRVEMVSAFMMIFCFVGYVAAQLLAMGLILQLLLGIGLLPAILASAIVVMTYTFYGGMWAVSLTDFLQSIMIISGLLMISWYLTKSAGGMHSVIDSIPEGHLNLLPEGGTSSYTNWFASWMVLGLGSIVSQDIFQRVNSARSERAAFYSTIFGAVLYLVFSALPLYIITAVRLLYPEEISGDLQLTLPNVILSQLPLPLQILFFGSVLSAIMSTCSGALLAPSSLLSENILKPLLIKEENDGLLLKYSRLAVICIGLISVFIALSGSKIFDLVGQSSVFGLVSLFFPFSAVLFFNYASKPGIYLSIFLGPLVWVFFNFIHPTEINALLFGSIASLTGLLIGLVIKALKEPNI